MPRISAYGVVGFALANTQAGFLPAAGEGSFAMLANIAFGLILFEFGYRINLRWLRTNPWIAVIGLLESFATFGVVCALMQWSGMSAVASLLLASLSMATSPAGILRVVNELRSSGQVTERVLHLSAVNCTLAVLAFKVVVGWWAYSSTGDIWHGLANSVLLLIVSAGLGVAFGAAVPAILRRWGNLDRDSTVAFALAIIALVAISHELKYSPVLAALSFGLVARHGRVVFNQAQRNFGALGDLLTVALFAFAAATLSWRTVWAGLPMGLALIAARLITKTVCVGLLSRASGVTWRKGVLSGVALAPISVFVLLLLEQTRSRGIDLIDQIAPLAAATLMLEIGGPMLTQWALKQARETARGPER